MYEKNKQQVTLASGDSFQTLKNKKGNATAVNYKAAQETEFAPYSISEYDLYGKLTKSIDSLNNLEYNYTYDKLGREASYSVKDTLKEKVISACLSEYDEDNCVKSSTVTVNDCELKYNYKYDSFPEHRLTEAVLPGGLIQTYFYDALGRKNVVTLGDAVNRYSYLGVGDHATNLISSSQFGFNNSINQRLKYSYDDCGNISQITENGKIIARYAYDGLNRLVREDNNGLNNTVTIFYDAGGNITSKNTYAFTLSSLQDKPFTSCDYGYSLSGCRDKLNSYNGKSVKYDSNGQPISFMMIC